MRLPVETGAKPRAKPQNRVTDSGPRWQGADLVFFHKSQLRIGTILVYWGRVGHGTKFQVEAITTSDRRGRQFQVGEADKLSDLVTLQSLSNTQVRLWVRFASLSYSAAWRIAGSPAKPPAKSPAKLKLVK